MFSNFKIFSDFKKKSMFFRFFDFRNLENENIFRKFSKLLKIKFDNIFFAYSRNLNLHHVIQSPAMNSAWPVTIFRLFEFQLQQIFTHNEWSFPRTSKCVKSSKNAKFLETYIRFFRRFFKVYYHKSTVWIICWETKLLDETTQHRCFAVDFSCWRTQLRGGSLCMEDA